MKPLATTVLFIAVMLIGLPSRAIGQLTTIDFPGAIQTNVAGINSHGDIVGRYVTPDTLNHMFVLSRGAFTTIDFPGATFTGGARSNNRGQVAGVYTLADGIRHGFLLYDGKFATINYPGAVATQLFDIDEHGVMVGHYLTPTEKPTVLS